MTIKFLYQFLGKGRNKVVKYEEIRPEDTFI